MTVTNKEPWKVGDACFIGAAVAVVRGTVVWAEETGEWAGWLTVEDASGNKRAELRGDVFRSDDEAHARLVAKGWCAAKPATDPAPLAPGRREGMAGNARRDPRRGTQATTGPTGLPLLEPMVLALKGGKTVECLCWHQPGRGGCRGHVIPPASLAGWPQATEVYTDLDLGWHAILEGRLDGRAGGGGHVWVAYADGRAT